ncbi:MAG TPA: hypothetical protein VHC90_19375 [Bryobacteraceae bacterium]|nr:hypothetical protein [Bryobacteraceae bacterium]
MRGFSFALLPALAFMMFVAPQSQAQVGVGLNIGPAPVCPYGYYEDSPYDCAPYGYYGPEWFDNGVFIGAGPWFHGPRDFHGHIDNHFRRDHGYRGEMPHRGDHADRHIDAQHFHGNEVHDGHGHAMNDRRH